MNTRIVLEIVTIVLLVLANGAFAMSEIAIVTARRARLETLSRAGKRGAAAALRLSNAPDRFLPTIQIGITTIGIFAGAFGGATLASEIDQWLETIPRFAPYSEILAVGIVVIAITYLSLVIGELVPKRLALNAPERIASWVAPWMERLSRVAAPAVSVLGISTRTILAILPKTPKPDPGATEEEVRHLLHRGAESGSIAKEERRMVERVFLLGDRSVRSVMTPRIEVEWLDLSRPVEGIRDQVSRSTHSRFPIAADRVDDAEGFIMAKDLWDEEITDVDAIRARIHEPLFVPETSSALHLVERIRETRTQVAFVLNEYGGFEGIVTPTDILEAIVGELPEVEDAEEPLIHEREDGSLSVDATVDVEEVRILLDVAHLEGQKETFQTIAGYVASLLGRPPNLGDVVEASGFVFEILDMDGRRVDRILITRLPDEVSP